MSKNSFITSKIPNIVTFLIFLLLIKTSFSDECKREHFLIDSTVQPPALIDSVICNYPLALLKKGIEGTVLLDITIEEDGKVSDVETIKGIHPVLDSIAKSSARKLSFKPALEEGKAIPVVIRFQYLFRFSEIMKRVDFTPNFKGRVIDKETRKPFCNIPVRCSFINLTSDTALAIPFRRYLKIIANIKSQELIQEYLVTRTDSKGHFSFFLLPVCSLKVRIDPFTYQTFTAGEKIFPGMVSEVIYRVFPPDKPSDYEIIVYGERSTSEKINIAEAEYKYGLSDQIDKVIFSKTGVNQVPEKGSSVLVHGGSIYDNIYYVSNVPMFPPSHFSNYSFADISGTMIATIENIEIITSRIGGRYSNAPGCVIKMQPGIYRPAQKKYLKRPELIVNMGIRQMDFSLSLPVRKKKDLYQLSYKWANEQLVKGRSLRASYADFGFGYPRYFSDATLTGQNNFKHLKINSLFWLAWDSYKEHVYFNRVTLPWGVANVTFESPGKPSHWKISLGGSRQHYHEGRKMGESSPLKTINRQNAHILLERQFEPFGAFNLVLNSQCEYLNWKGKIDKRYFDFHEELLHRDAEEINIQGQIGLNKEGKLITAGCDLLAGTIYPYKNFFIDPGIWWKVPLENGSVDFSAGIVSSSPDIRGIPSSAYRSKITKTFMITSKFEHSFGIPAKFSLEPYVRWRDNTPAFSADYHFPIWDDTLATNLYARGINGILSFYIRDFMDIELGGTVNEADRLVNGTRESYEWNIPWSIKSMVHLKLFKEILHFYLNPVISAGIPYRDIADNNKMKQGKPYIRSDISIQVRNTNIEHRYVTRYDLYVGLENIGDFKNESDCYWDYDMTRKKINLTPFYFSLGGRFAFRL